MKYKLNINRDVDITEGSYMLNTPRGYRLNEYDLSHVRGFDTLEDLTAFVKNNGVITCDCKECKLS